MLVSADYADADAVQMAMSLGRSPLYVLLRTGGWKSGVLGSGVGVRFWIGWLPT